MSVVALGLILTFMLSRYGVCMRAQDQGTNNSN